MHAGQLIETEIVINEVDCQPQCTLQHCCSGWKWSAVFPSLESHNYRPVKDMWTSSSLEN